jgi:hypothetical protein
VYVKKGANPSYGALAFDLFPLSVLTLFQVFEELSDVASGPKVGITFTAFGFDDFQVSMNLMM